MRARLQGTARIRCIVQPSGVCTNIEIEHSLDKTFGLDQEAIDSVKLWRFKPGMRLGQAVPVLVTIDVRPRCAETGGAGGGAISHSSANARVGSSPALAAFSGTRAPVTRRIGTPDHPTVTVKGQTFTPGSILSRNMGTDADQTTAFPPHKIIGNIYYVGTRTLSSFLIVTPQGNILIDSTYERNVPTIEKSVAQLGFKFSDIKILLGNHAHNDHQEGDAAVKAMTGAQVIAMAEDVPALQALKTRRQGTSDRQDHSRRRHGRARRNDARRAPHAGPHARLHHLDDDGAGGRRRTYNVVFGCSLRAPNVVTPAIADELTRSFKIVRALPCDVQLGDHPAEYNMQAKYAKLRNIQNGGPNPFIEPATCLDEADVEEAMFHAILNEQR